MLHRGLLKMGQIAVFLMMLVCLGHPAVQTAKPRRRPVLAPMAEAVPVGAHDCISVVHSFARHDWLLRVARVPALIALLWVLATVV